MDQLVTVYRVSEPEGTADNDLLTTLPCYENVSYRDIAIWDSAIIATTSNKMILMANQKAFDLYFFKPDSRLSDILGFAAVISPCSNFEADEELGRCYLTPYFALIVTSKRKAYVCLARFKEKPTNFDKYFQPIAADSPWYTFSPSAQERTIEKISLDSPEFLVIFFKDGGLLRLQGGTIIYYNNQREKESASGYRARASKL